MTPRTITILPCILLVMFARASANDDAGRPPELKVLGRMVGEFDMVLTTKPGVWSPKGSRATFVVKSRWVLNNRFLQSEGKGTRVEGEERESIENLTMITWDPHRKEYRNAFFFASYGEGTDDWGDNSRATTGTTTSRWDDAMTTFTVSVKDDDAGITIDKVMTWTDGDHYGWTVTVKDADDGEVLMEQVCECTRRKSK
ncbi:MAG: hypothetical protein WD768_13165 [Phycisphaeraceae bacterium]